MPLSSPLRGDIRLTSLDTAKLRERTFKPCDVTLEEFYVVILRS